MLAVLGGGPLAKLKVSRSLSVYWLKGSSGRCANCLHSSLHWCRCLVKQNYMTCHFTKQLWCSYAHSHNLGDDF